MDEPTTPFISHLSVATVDVCCRVGPSSLTIPINNYDEEDTMATTVETRAEDRIYHQRTTFVIATTKLNKYCCCWTKVTTMNEPCRCSVCLL